MRRDLTGQADNAILNLKKKISVKKDYKLFSQGLRMIFFENIIVVLGDIYSGYRKQNAQTKEGSVVSLLREDFIKIFIRENIYPCLYFGNNSNK